MQIAAHCNAAPCVSASKWPLVQNVSASQACTMKKYRCPTLPPYKNVAGCTARNIIWFTRIWLGNWLVCLASRVIVYIGAAQKQACVIYKRVHWKILFTFMSTMLMIHPKFIFWSVKQCRWLVYWLVLCLSMENRLCSAWIQLVGWNGSYRWVEMGFFPQMYQFKKQLYPNWWELQN